MDVRDVGEGVAIVVSGSGNPAGAAADAQERSDLLARAFDVPIEVAAATRAAMHA
jgi:hypothetical protein